MWRSLKRPNSVSMTPRAENINPIGIRISRPINYPLSEDDVEDRDHYEHDDGERSGTRIPGHVFFVWLFGQRINKADEFFLLARPGHKADDNGDDKAGRPCPDGGPEVLRHLAGIGVQMPEPAAFDSDGCGYGQSESVMQGRRDGAGKQPGEGSVTGGALPEHSEQEGRE